MTGPKERGGKAASKPLRAIEQGVTVVTKQVSLHARGQNSIDMITVIGCCRTEGGDGRGKKEREQQEDQGKTQPVGNGVRRRPENP